MAAFLEVPDSGELVNTFVELNLVGVNMEELPRERRIVCVIK